MERLCYKPNERICPSKFTGGEDFFPRTIRPVNAIPDPIVRQALELCHQRRRFGQGDIIRFEDDCPIIRGIFHINPPNGRTRSVDAKNDALILPVKIHTRDGLNRNTGRLERRVGKLRVEMHALQQKTTRNHPLTLHTNQNTVCFFCLTL